jgi:hypothetical protein
MRSILSALVLLVAVSGAHAKVFDQAHVPRMPWRLQEGDSFSVECKNDQTGVIDRESVDVDPGTVTVEIPGKEPAVHKILSFALGMHQGQDRFGALSFELYVQDASWGRLGNTGVGLILSGNRWLSHHEDNSYWTCANDY